jgi:LuxR family maltose regulon positive regulatory protein
LLALLDRTLEHRLTLVSAPAGFGKTTLVRQWVAERSKQPQFPPVAWVSLDGGDNDPVRFWRYLMTAGQVFRDNVAQEALALLRSMPHPSFEASLTETPLTVFLNALAQCEQGGILLLDDYHAITSPRIHQTMTFFLAHLPASIHIIIITRSDPPFSLTQLRARNELSDVRSSDLRFSLEETSAFLQQTLPVPLAPEVVQRVNAYLEGWGAGLRLLLIALRESATPREIEPLLRVFAGGQHALQEYFLIEVLAIGQYLSQEFHEVQAILLLARIQHVRGETAAARQRLDALLTRIPVTLADHAWPLSREVLTLQARLALADKDLVAVQRWITGLDRSGGLLFPFATEQEKLILARWHLA